jgi:hypothetical protein
MQLFYAIFPQHINDLPGRIFTYQGNEIIPLFNETRFLVISIGFIYVMHHAYVACDFERIGSCVFKEITGSQKRLEAGYIFLYSKGT